MKKRNRGAEYRLSHAKTCFDLSLAGCIVLICVVTAIVCLGLAIYYVTSDGVKAGAFLVVVLGFGALGGWLAVGVRRYFLFYWRSLRTSECYRVKARSLQRLSTDGEIIEEVPYENIKRLEHVVVKNEYGATEKEYIGINLRKKKDPDTTVDPDGFAWSRAAFEYDLVIMDCFIKGKFKDFSEELQGRMESTDDPGAPLEEV
jgi:hypothetical protein